MLQLAQATATLANGGLKYKPKIVIATQDAVTRTKHPIPSVAPENLGFSPENVAIIRNAMVGVTKEGTSVRSFAGAATSVVAKLVLRKLWVLVKMKNTTPGALTNTSATMLCTSLLHRLMTQKLPWPSWLKMQVLDRTAQHLLHDVFLTIGYSTNTPVWKTWPLCKVAKAARRLGSPRLAADVPLIPSAQAAAEELASAPLPVAKSTSLVKNTSAVKIMP